MSEQPMRDDLEFDLIDRLHKSLRISGMSGLAMGKALGVHRNTVNNYLSGRTRPDRRTLITWALSTGVPFGWLESGHVGNPDGGPATVEGWAPRDSNPEPTDSTFAQVIPLRKAA